MLETFQNATDVVWIEDLGIDGEPVSHLSFADRSRQAGPEVRLQ